MAARPDGTMNSRVVEIEGRRLILSHLDAVLWPEEEVTKG